MRYIKYLLQSIGIFILLGCFFNYTGHDTVTLASGKVVDVQAINPTEETIILVATIGYFVIRSIYEYQKSPSVQAQSWRTRFDSSKECQQYLTLIKRLQPKWIYLTYNRPPEEVAPSPPVNRLYPQPQPKQAPFVARIQMKDDKGNVVFAQDWPLGSGPSARESMDLFYDWMSHHLPENLVYELQNHEGRVPSAAPSKPSYYTVSETVDGRHIVSAGGDSYDPPTPHYGYILTRKA